MRRVLILLVYDVLILHGLPMRSLILNLFQDLTFLDSDLRQNEALDPDLRQGEGTLRQNEETLR